MGKVACPTPLELAWSEDPAALMARPVMVWVKALAHRKGMRPETADDMVGAALVRAVTIARLPPGDTRRINPAYYHDACLFEAINSLRMARGRWSRSKDPDVCRIRDGEVFLGDLADDVDAKSLRHEDPQPDFVSREATDRLCEFVNRLNDRMAPRPQDGQLRREFVRQLAQGEDPWDIFESMGRRPRSGQQMLNRIQNEVRRRYTSPDHLRRHLGWV